MVQKGFPENMKFLILKMWCLEYSNHSPKVPGRIPNIVVWIIAIRRLWCGHNQSGHVILSRDSRSGTFHCVASRDWVYLFLSLVRPFWDQILRHADVKNTQGNDGFKKSHRNWDVCAHMPVICGSSRRLVCFFIPLLCVTPAQTVLFRSFSKAISWYIPIDVIVMISVCSPCSHFFMLNSLD